MERDVARSVDVIPAVEYMLGVEIIELISHASRQVRAEDEVSAACSFRPASARSRSRSVVSAPATIGK